ncbi:hypothetical protein WJX72_010838 [[Myrmecia] bisecta]|uniref:Activator of Hsp90 ATPase AHSA1-like N-terminal domain-containing protein n=1 Tax=[Myrmecia] bisecta TaxID=41462 RepID=A0AAW1R910_9CHLO
MAKWCEKDPRWVVADREDGSNVNGWHWEEKNKVAWSRARLADLLEGLESPQEEGVGAQITGVTDLTGEALLTIRKGNKKFAVFDLTLTLAWAGRCGEESNEVKGEVKITEFASTNEEDEYHFEVSATGTGKEQDQLKQTVKRMRPAILKQLAVFVAEINQLQQ